MERFSYDLEFYKNNLFDLDNIKLFKRKVKEAKEIESFFWKIIPNIEYIRKYILRSYYMNKSYGKITRIRYIKGLILADSIIDFDDIREFSSIVSENIFIEDKITLWRNKEYVKDSLDEQILNDKYQDTSLNVIESINNVDPLYIDDYIDEEIEDDIGTTLLKITSDNSEYTGENEILSENYVPMSLEQKIYEFKKNKSKIINDIIKIKNISKEEEKIVKKGMRDWLNFAIDSLETIYKLKINSLTLNDKNLYKYL